MDAESFTELALRELAGDTTDVERRALQTELSASPARLEEFQRLKITHDILRTTVPMTEAARATAPELPAHRLNELRTAVRQHFGPEVVRPKAEARSGGFLPILRWILAGGGLTAAVVVIAVFLMFSNRTVEVGLYGSDIDLVRGDHPLSTSDVPTAHLVTFDQDAPFDQWQARPLAWYEHAKIWVDNDNDLLHIIRRAPDGSIVTETQPLLQGKNVTETTNVQREQIKRAVESLK